MLQIILCVSFSGGASADTEQILAPLEMRTLAAIAFGIFISFKMFAGILHLGYDRLSAFGILRFCDEIGIYDVGLAASAVYVFIVSVSQFKNLSFYINDLVKLAFFVLLFGWREDG